jgi:hypothetical protein
MPAKSSIYSNALLRFVFNSTPVAELGSLNLYVSLHNANPGANGNQSTNECDYSGYARAAVAKTSNAWIVVANTVSPAVPIVFPTVVSGVDVVTHFGIGTEPSGDGLLLYYGSVLPTIGITTGITPQLRTTTMVTES